jgi:hypothetical protein
VWRSVGVAPRRESSDSRDGNRRAPLLSDNVKDLGYPILDVEGQNRSCAKGSAKVEAGG